MATTSGVDIWNVSTGQLEMQLGSGDFVFGISWAPDSNSIAAVDYVQTSVWNVETGVATQTFLVNASPVAWAPDGAQLAVASWSDYGFV